MKKLFVLVSCVAVLLVLSNVSFAQEVAAVEATPCTCCCTCDVTAPAFPFHPHFYAAPKHFGGRLAGKGCLLRGPQAFPFPAKTMPFPPQAMPFPPQPMPFPPQVMPFPAPPEIAGYYGAPPVRPLAARRAARQAMQPFPMAFAPQTVGAPPAFMHAAPPAFVPAPAPFQQHSVTSMGDLNRVSQRYGGAPTINFLSVVRGAPRGYDPYAGYYPPMYGYPQPELEAAPAQ